MNLLQTIHRVCEAFFLVCGFLYLLAFIFWRNDFHPYESEIFLQLADLPLALFGIFFGFTSVRLSIKEQYEDGELLDKKFHFSDAVTLFFAFLLFALVVYVDLAFPNQFPFPKFTS
ncbi:hypothetical protein IPN35_01730 [Candidatus Peregrinibacteria bacterium]|nr:MAG: hypothetical protein IPN35_01730 [Candidatus Peregrinibacteria bacterium]